MGHIRSTETVASALKASDDGMPDAENAVKHGVAIKTIRRWRREYQRRGRPRGRSDLVSKCPRCDNKELEATAYAELLGWYLGDGYISLGRRGVYGLHIVNDAKYTGLNAGLLTLMRRVKPGCRPHTRNAPGAVITTVSWKHWPCLFPQHGPGRKHERKLTLEEWQRKIVNKHPAGFFRGLLHSDGCRTTNWATGMVGGVKKRYEYPRWQFVNNSEDIRRWCTEALDLLGISWRQSNWKSISVARREAVARLDELVGPKH